MGPICYLLKLPAELRLRIYEQVFDLRNDQSRLDYHADRYGTFDLSKYPAGLCKLELSARGIIKSCSLGDARLRASPLRNFTAVLQTSHLINREATEVLYAQTFFRISCGATPIRGGRLLCASRNACFNFRHTSIYDRKMMQLLRQAQNAEVVMQFDGADHFLDVLPAVDVLLSILSVTQRIKARSSRITLTEWLPLSVDSIDPWTWHDILTTLKGMRFACVPEIVAHPCPWSDDPKMERLRDLTRAAGGVLVGDCEVRKLPLTDRDT